MQLNNQIDKYLSNKREENVKKYLNEGELRNDVLERRIGEIKKEYDELKNKDLKTLEIIYKRLHRVSDTRGMKKWDFIPDILVGEYGSKAYQEFLNRRKVNESKEEIDENAIKTIDEGLIKKVGDKWRVVSGKTGKLWPAHYDSEEDAKKGLSAYFVNKHK